MFKIISKEENTLDAIEKGGDYFRVIRTGAERERKGQERDL